MKNWYSTTLTLLGVALIITGVTFFMITFPAGVPVIPIIGVALVFYGIWVIRQR